MYGLTTTISVDTPTISRRLQVLGGDKVVSDHESKGRICCSLSSAPRTGLLRRTVSTLFRVSYPARRWKGTPRHIGITTRFCYTWP